MSDYEFRCPECKKVTTTHSTGEVPQYGDKAECISCGRVSIIQDSLTTLIVAMSTEKIHPSKLEELELEKKDINSGGEE